MHVLNQLNDDMLLHQYQVLFYPFTHIVPSLDEAVRYIKELADGPMRVQCFPRSDEKQIIPLLPGLLSPTNYNAVVTCVRRWVDEAIQYNVGITSTLDGMDPRLRAQRHERCCRLHSTIFEVKHRRLCDITGSTLLICNQKVREEMRSYIILHLPG